MGCLGLRGLRTLSKLYVLVLKIEVLTNISRCNFFLLNNLRIYYRKWIHKEKDPIFNMGYEPMILKGNSLSTVVEYTMFCFVFHSLYLINTKFCKVN